MQQKLNEFSTSVIISAIEENLREYWVNYGHAPQSELYDSPELLRIFTGVPLAFLNGVSCRQLSPDSVDRAFDETLSFFQKWDIPWGWVVGPQPVPASLPESLVKHGLVLHDESYGMAIHLDAISHDLPAIPQLEIVEVNDAETLRVWASTALDGFVLPECDPTFVDLECSLGTRQTCYRRFLAILNHKPVATSAVYLGEKVAGIYGVATLPTARKLGIGGAITQKALHEALARGYHVAVLQASQMGRSVYQRLGFKEFSTLRTFAFAD